MAFVQFRVHPGVGCARFGNSSRSYYLASEFPYFLQEQFPRLRFRPKPRTHPRSFFKAGGPDAEATPEDPADYKIYIPPAASLDNRFKEPRPGSDDRDTGLLLPQAVRFRVFAYVYDSIDNRWPQMVFEVTTAIADITWKVNVANKKSKKTTGTPKDPHENLTTTSTELDTLDARLLCKRVRPVAGLPTLAYLFLERDDTNKALVTGRLHIIGNEGDIQGDRVDSQPSELWWDDWYDGAADGRVEADVRPKAGGAPLRALAGIASVEDLKYLDYGVAAPRNGSVNSIHALPGWVVVGPPDYVPDMGHFVSLWDVAFSRALESVEARTVTAQPGTHKLIRSKAELNTYKFLDYDIHIHPQLCLFEDVRFVSGDTVAQPEEDRSPPHPPARGHNLHPGTPPPAATEPAAIKHGGLVIRAREDKADLEDPSKLREPDRTQPINTWLKKAVLERLRKPDTLYKKRKFIIVPPTGSSDKAVLHSFPRKLGRRLDYHLAPGAGSDKNKFFHFPDYVTDEFPGNLLDFHGLRDAGKLCGGKKSPPSTGPGGAPHADSDAAKLLQYLDDMFWPANARDMPQLRELAYTKLQYDQFAVWQGTRDLRRKRVFDVLLAAGVRTSFGEDEDVDEHFAEFLAARPLYAPALIDMAHLGAMLGGSFLPGIEVGREAGIPRNWWVFHGASSFFPSIRFKPTDKNDVHRQGTLTKDLAIPWSQDFKACDELFWPTSRPGRTTQVSDPLPVSGRISGASRQNWQIEITDEIPHLDAGRTAGGVVEFVKEYWKALGFIRRTTDNQFLEQEQSWH